MLQAEGRRMSDATAQARGRATSPRTSATCVAVSDVSMRVGTRRAACDHRPERRRQDDVLQPDHRLLPADRRATSCSTARTSTACRPPQRVEHGHGPHLPDHRDLSGAHGAGERPDRASRRGLGFSLRAWLTRADKQRVADALDEVLAHGQPHRPRPTVWSASCRTATSASAEIAMALALKPPPAAARRADRRHGRRGDLPGHRPDPPPAPRLANTPSC